MAKTFTKDEVASHSKGNNPWVIIDEDVYDVSQFQDEHPGMSKSQRSVSHANTFQVEKRVGFYPRIPTNSVLTST